MSLPVGRSLQVLIALAGVIMAIVVILQSRGDVRDRLQQRAAARGDMTSRALAAVGRVWHVFAILYVLIFFVVWVSRTGDALTYMLAATGTSSAAVLGGFTIVTADARPITGGLPVPQETVEPIPHLYSHPRA